MIAKSFIPVLTELRGFADRTVNRLQDNIRTALAGFQNGIADGLLSQTVIPTSSTVNSCVVNHPLGRKPQGVLVVNRTAPYDVTIAPAQPANIDPAVQIQLVVTALPGASITGPVSCGIWWF